ncbi:prepilin-type N-terminal cleavage/methylation domain-containing protein [Archangium primigenium]|uniref:prepilin-type N-terminal cleavage/methylation domain-containing protein n=1 Tax=[Archangium] primigenium TaxID=2792470 RepID=UPI0019569578|nr:PilW family protein [Archangium primigenium]MBM7114673.1 PilW family protein [Archangium primigenium]
MTSRSPRTPRGFTLIELMVGTVTTTIILAAVALTVLAVQGSYQTESRIQVAVEGSRTAISFLEQRLRLASYGVDPRFAFDFGTDALDSHVKSNEVIALGDDVPVSVTDDLALRYRDPAWLRRGSLDGTRLLLEDGDVFDTAFPEGQRFILACKGSGNSVVLRLGAGGLSKGSSETSNFTVDETLSTSRRSEACLSKRDSTMPMVLLLHEVRVRIVDLNGRPFLMAFSTLENLDPAKAVPLAADVESFQVAYLMNRPQPDSAFRMAPAVDASSNPANWVLGDVGSAETERMPNPGAVPVPRFGTSYDDASRYNAHPANIRAVRVSVTVRSTNPELRGRRGFLRVDLEDSPEHATEDGYYRTTLTTTVRAPNMMSRSAFIPDLSRSDEPEQSNRLVWGG